MKGPRKFLKHEFEVFVKRNSKLPAAFRDSWMWHTGWKALRINMHGKNTIKPCLLLLNKSIYYFYKIFIMVCCRLHSAVCFFFFCRGEENKFSFQTLKSPLLRRCAENLPILLYTHAALHRLPPRRRVGAKGASDLGHLTASFWIVWQGCKPLHLQESQSCILLCLLLLCSPGLWFYL